LYHEDHEDNTEGDLFSTGLAAYFIH
jgi:hypothetical protein